MVIKSFFKNVSNYKELQNLDKRFKGLIFSFDIIATVELLDRNVNFFDDFKHNCAFLKPYIYTTKLDKGTFECVLIEHAEKRMLVVMNGYQYPRYVAIF